MVEQLGTEKYTLCLTHGMTDFGSNLFTYTFFTLQRHHIVLYVTQR